ncbi:MAG: hypothetical protein V4493_03080 [Pseudomonadota bacterium]
MSDRPLIAPQRNKPIINAHSTGASFNGTPSIIQRLPGISYDIAWTGTTHGTISIEVSNTYSIDATGAVLDAGNWNALPSAAFIGTLPAPAGSPGNGFIDVIGTEAYAIRPVFTRTDGTGTMTIQACAKVL